MYLLRTEQESDRPYAGQGEAIMSPSGTYVRLGACEPCLNTEGPYIDLGFKPEDVPRILRNETILAPTAKTALVTGVMGEEQRLLSGTTGLEGKLDEPKGSTVQTPIPI